MGLQNFPLNAVAWYEEQRAKVGGGVAMTTDIDLLLLQRSGTVRKAVCTFVSVCRGESDVRGCVFVV